jgi:hypothetical protein
MKNKNGKQNLALAKASTGVQGLESVRRTIGDPSDRQRVLLGLDLKPKQ